VSDEALRDLAGRAGVEVAWTNAAGQDVVVAVPVLRHVLDKLGYPAVTPAQIAESRERIAHSERRAADAPLLTAGVNEPIELPAGRTHAGTSLLTFESGAQRVVKPERAGDRLRLKGIEQPGYHTLALDNGPITLAVAPKRCFTTEDIGPDQRMWGAAVQLYGLRHKGDGGIGNTAGVSAFARSAAKFGSDAVGLSPAHAVFGADPTRYSPYSPSSRLFFNPLHADPAVVFGPQTVATTIDDLGLSSQWAALESGTLIDWPASASAKFALFRRLFEDLERGERSAQWQSLRAALADFRRRGGELLEQHALFEALHAVCLAADRRAWNWRQWPREWRDPQNAQVRTFAADQAREISFHIFLQWIADRSFAAAQASARDAGMRIGLIADLATGMDAAGSHAWSRQQEIVVGLNIGAPPDLFNPLGQDWGLTAFSPRGLKSGGFAPFIATLRAVLRHAGGLRIDHAMGLRRLWVIPEGASPAEGAYLNYPLKDLLRLIKLESTRHAAIVIGEDLGTVPTGFRESLADAGIAGMSVLWFERKEDDFRPPQDWPAGSVAMTSTHDLPTVAGWWQSADVDRRAALGLLGSAIDAPAEKQQRASDRARLWSAFEAAGVTADRSTPADVEGAVDAAIRFVAMTPAQLALVPLEDLLGLMDQPNLPGTLDEHPNWRRRYPSEATGLLDAPMVQNRARSLASRTA
jgi:4-alpha-glucanotransferase